MNNVTLMFRIDVGFDSDRGYAAVLADVQDRKMKGVKGGSIRQLMKRVSETICEEEQRKRRFPIESEKMIVATEEDGNNA